MDALVTEGTAFVSGALFFAKKESGKESKASINPLKIYAL